MLNIKSLPSHNQTVHEMFTLMLSVSYCVVMTVRFTERQDCGGFDMYGGNMMGILGKGC